jgi:hypothetical protein
MDVEEAWDWVVDRLADNGIPLYKLTDPVDEAGIPSVAVVIAIFSIILAAFAFYVVPFPKQTLSVTTDPGAEITVEYGVVKLERTTSDGTEKFEIPRGSTADVRVAKKDCEVQTQTVLMADDYAAVYRLRCL